MSVSDSRVVPNEHPQFKFKVLRYVWNYVGDSRQPDNGMEPDILIYLSKYLNRRKVLVASFCSTSSTRDPLAEPKAPIHSSEGLYPIWDDKI